MSAPARGPRTGVDWHGRLASATLKTVTVSPDFRPRPGAVLAGYQLEALLGRGGMGSVWVGRHTELGVRRAIKISVLSGESRQKRFEREAHALAKVDRHPGVVGVHAYGVAASGLGYMVLDLVEGGDLEQLLGDGPLPWERAVEIVGEVAFALAHLHQRGIVHRDVKPANVFMTREGKPVLGDLGVARDAEAQRLTKTGAFVGTPHYVAPEGVAGKREQGPRSDVYALGVVLYRALTGRLPFETERMAELLVAITEAPVIPPSELRPGLPAALDYLVLATLEKDLEDRPSALEFGEALQAVGRGDPAPALSNSRPTARLVRRIRRREPWLLGLILLVVFLAAGLAAVVGVLLLRGEARRTLEEHARWEARALDPYRYGLGGAELSPANQAALVSRQGPLGVAGSRLRGEEARAAALALERLKALERLRAHRAGEQVNVPDQVGGRSTPALAVDALVLSERGHARGALRRLERLLAQEPDSPGSARLRLTVLAESKPEAFLRELEEAAPGELRDFGLDLAPRCLETLYAERLELAVVPLGPSPVELRALRSLVEQAARLGLPLDALSRLKRRAFEAVALEWERQLGGAEDSLTEQSLLRQLQELGASPQLQAGPRLSRSLDAVLGSLADRHAQLMRQHDPDGARAVLDRLLRLDSLGVYALGRRWVPPAESVGSLVMTLRGRAEGKDVLDAQLTFAVLRWGGKDFSARRLAGRFSMDALNSASTAHPRSRAARFCQILRAPEGGAVEDPAERADYVDRLERLLAEGIDDLVPSYLAEARLTLIELLAHDDLAGARWSPELCQRIRAQARVARRDLVTPSLRTDAYRLEVRATLSLEGAEAGLRVWDQAVVYVERQLEGGVDPIMRAKLYHELASCLRQKGVLLLATGRMKEAESTVRRSLAQQALTNVGGVGDGRAVLAEILEKQGRVEEAIEFALSGFPEGFESEHLSANTAKLLRRQGDPRFAEFLETALRHHPDDADLGVLLEPAEGRE